MSDTSTETTMEVNAEARRILAVSISKLYASRSQRGGLRLHRSLLLSLVMRSARDIYHSSAPPAEPMDTSPEEPVELDLESGPQSDETPAELSSTAGGGAHQEAEEEEGEPAEDKENQSPTRRSRKRRGRMSVAPHFLPSKRARLEPGEERHASPLLPPPPPASCRMGPPETLTTLSMNWVIPAC
ncbi:immediate early response 2b [Corythoichthys intestinalis]|uniref:immediate early response 2b n=1 Tax=Corythoichthys intestinalis TaxID=161448 RepID=UPI0025A5A9DD|nr:immediate early response 2b [Corythoichthys intestinalis]XP_061791430.1 immediate early response gene 2 protein-like [Nerophis lumbriciformis]